MRAGLLSQPEVIERINRQFVATWTVIDDAERRARQGDALARLLAAHWEYPLDLMFLSPDGRVVSKLNSFRDLRGAHADVGHPPEGRGLAARHVTVFFKHIDDVFGPND